MTTRAVVVCTLAALTGCASYRPELGHDEVAATVKARTGLETGWESGPPDPEAVRARVRELVHDGLTREDVLRIALVNSPELQNDFEELGIAQADLVQAGLLSNPRISGALMFPDTSGSIPKLEFSLVQEVLDLVMLPARRSVAETQFRATVLRIGQRALDVVAEASMEFADAQAAQKLLQYRVTQVATLEAAAELARLQFEAGGNTALDLATQKSAWEDAKTELARDEVQWLARRERLNRLLGLWGADAEWTIAEPLPELPAQDPDITGLEARAIRNRLDVAAARAELQLVDQAVALARSSRFVGTVEVGVQGEREEDRVTVVGPSLSLELPIFDQRQALMARLEAQQRQAERRLQGVSIVARSQVREATAEFVAARRLVMHFQNEVLPTKRQVVDQSQLQYNAMTLGPYQLFEARRDEARTMSEYVSAQATYWNARTQLERATGGKLEDAR